MLNKKELIIKSYNNGYLLYNPYTDVIVYSDTLSPSSETIEYYKNIGLLFDKSVDSSAIARFIINSCKSTDALQLTEAFSYSCNLKCVYCIQQNIKEKPVLMSPRKRIDEWKQLMNLHNVSKINVCLFGGEPFFNIRYLSEVLELANKEIGDIAYTAITNATLIDHRVINLINTYSIQKLQITLDGLEETHNKRRVNNNINCFRDIINNIHKILQETSCTIILNSVIDTENFDEINQMTDYMIDNFSEYILSDKPRIVFNYGMECHPFGKSSYTKEHIPELKNYNLKFLELLKKQLLKGVATTEIMPTPICIAKDPNDVLIAPNGDIYKCISGLDVPEFKIASYDDLFNKPFQYFEKVISFSYRNYPSCNTCKYFSLCDGGCYYQAAIDGVQQNCQKSLFDAQMDILIELRYITEEIESGVFKIHDYNNTNR